MRRSSCRLWSFLFFAYFVSLSSVYSVLDKDGFETSFFSCKHSLPMKRSLNQNHSCPKFSREQRLACGPTVVHAAEPDSLGFGKKNFRGIMTQKQFIVAGGSVRDRLGRLKNFDGFLDLSRP